MKMILFNQNPMITKLLESVSKKLELSMEDFNRYQELSTRLKEEPEWILIADDECLEKLDQVDWLELKEIISQNKNSVCMYKKGNEVQPFLEGFEMKIKKPFLPTEALKVLQKKLGSNMSELEPSQNLDPTQEVLETNWDELENLGDLEALVQEEPNNEEQLLPTLNDQEEKEEVKETPQEEKPKDDEIQEGETLKDEEISKELETQEELEIPKEETQEIKEEKQEKTQDSPSTQELEAMQELVKEIQENSNGQEDKKETQENTETPQELEKQELEKQEKTQESAETPQDVETPQEKEKQELETPQEKEKQELETPQEKEIPQEEIQENTEKMQKLEKQELEKQEKTQESAETPQDVEIPQEEIQENTEKMQKLETQEDHYESIEDIPEPVMAQAMGEELPFLNESVAKIPNNENDTETPKESVIKTPQEKEESDKTSSPLELRLNLQDLLKSLNQESLKSLLENKTLSIKITLEDKKPDA
ncbi:hypothetical protein JP0103_01350 [Helicobacter pylori]|uniref:hypothetical protein n=1 Tax=Helicobacter pylori TaxID=210 RepID=UPI001AA747B5|nr:hypothetical protein [Helicobacter pylori]GHR61639.1 hypothetical protein JP0103_01350 [Helicobacter pylori]